MELPNLSSLASTGAHGRRSKPAKAKTPVLSPADFDELIRRIVAAMRARYRAGRRDDSIPTFENDDDLKDARKYFTTKKNKQLFHNTKRFLKKLWLAFFNTDTLGSYDYWSGDTLRQKPVEQAATRTDLFDILETIRKFADDETS